MTKFLQCVLFYLFALRTTSFSQEHPTGQVLNKGAVMRLSIKSPAKEDIALPTSVNLRPFCPPVTSQSWGTCYSYSSVYAGRTILYNRTQNETSHPEKNIFSTGFIQKLIRPREKNCRKWGADTHEACEKMQTVGAVFKTDYPEDCSTQAASEALKEKAKAYQIKATRLYEFCSENKLKIQKIKESLSKKNPVVIGINSTSSFHKDGGDPDLWMPTSSDHINCNSANHAVCIIGYDNNKFGGAFEIMNSWGNDWKGDGFVWVKYNDLANFAMFAIEIANK